jgi:DNA-binding MarR family transcriptional regulator
LASVAITMTRIARHVEYVLAPLDLSPAQYRLLAQLTRGPERSAIVARRLSVKPPTLTSLVDGLAQRGAIERSTSKEDRRGVYLALTEAGRALLTQAQHVVAQRLATALETVEPAVAKSAVEAMATWAEALARYRLQLEEAALGVNDAAGDYL